MEMGRDKEGERKENWRNSIDKGTISCGGGHSFNEVWSRVLKGPMAPFQVQKKKKRVRGRKGIFCVYSKKCFVKLSPPPLLLAALMESEKVNYSPKKK
ncbi:hypothetical protein Btru_056536 [Bulinus truncatus]|nr:hypothetical protein Btru_056536 [Bulinus truncatus]